MPDPIRQALQAAKVRAPDTSRRQRREEPQWTEYSVLAYDGLMPTQIVLRMTDREGIDRWEATALPFRVDARADTDDRRNDKVPFLPADPMRYVDERRYVVDPMPGKHEVLGLWTGGPVRMTTDKRSGGIEVTRVLTRTFCAGHGYTVDEHGNYVAAFTEDGGTTFHDKDGHALDASKVREYLSADDALRFHRASLGSRLSPYMLLRNDFPAAYTREVQWREFTHESIKFLDPLGLKPENRPRLSAIVGEKFKELAGEAVTNAACRVDAETNTVIFTAALTYSKLGEPDGPEDLLRLPCLETCDRDTLRLFGWNQLRDGEGYKYTHMFRWPRLRDTPEVRKALEFVKDNAPMGPVYAEVEDGSDSDSDPDSVLLVPAAPSFVLALLYRHGLLPADGDSARAWFGDGSYEKRFAVTVDGSQLDATGRLVTSATARGDADGSDSDEDVPVQSYRIAKQRFEPDQDGSLSFVILLVKTEWHGGDDGKNWEDGGSRVLAGVSSPQGYGRTEQRVVTSVPRENAIPTLNGIKPGEWDVVTHKRQTEGQEGSSDVSFEKKRVYDYIDPPGTGHTPLVVNVDGTNFNAPDYRYDPETNIYSLSFPQVKQDRVQALIDALRQKLGGDPKIHVQDHGDGSCTVSVTGRSLQPRHVKEWTVEADWFSHQTVEQWIGVATNVTRDGSDSDDDDIKGFYAKYVKTEQGQLVPDQTSWVPLAAVRGDLDADWMGSQPQTPHQGKAPVLYYTIGTGDAKSGPVPNVDHEDEHGDGWNGDAWTDPDAAGDSADKARSHVLTRVRPRLNGDGTLDLTITRIYPHQRSWEWETEKNNGRKDGEWKTVYHVEYRNWPSRQAIKKDLVERWAKEKGVQLDGSEYTYSFAPNVNQFGLVDAANVAIEPLFWSSGKKSRNQSDEDLEDASRYRMLRNVGIPTSARLMPKAQDYSPPFAPIAGFYFSFERQPVWHGHGYTEDEAWNVWDYLVETFGAAEGGREPSGTNESDNWSFRYVGPWAPSNVFYNGWPPAHATPDTYEVWFNGGLNQNGQNMGGGISSQEVKAGAAAAKGNIRPPAT